ncbi:beta-lactamase class A [Salegentibacter sp. 24]|uniref:serine hydrolase n=1 Tax=Salegentibacter sp. 24 TaxID=2183986 RepID=UPI00105EA5DA|nr:serine hydrolase [Salegentibacter sp. 24]TDN85931.1 beta-lactamase class A [Salegentibacter sp. 24]
MKIFAIFLFLFYGLISHAQSSTEELQEQITNIFKRNQGEFAIAFKNLSKKNDSILIQEKKDFHAASTMKTPVMIEVFKQASEGKFSLQDSLTIKNEFISILDGSSYSLELGRDSGEHLYALIGNKRSIENLTVDMIINSSNLATNILIELVDAKNVNKTMKNLGATNINVLRGVEDIKAYEAGLSNTTTAYDLMLIFEALAKGIAVSPVCDQKMLDILYRQKHTDVIPALLPENLKIANKTGWITGVHHDSALVELPDGKQYVLVLLSKNMENMQAGTKMLSEISKMIYDHVNSN